MIVAVDERAQARGLKLNEYGLTGADRDVKCRDEAALFTGDVVLSGSTSVIPSGDGDLLDYMNSLKRLQGLDVRRIYSAHGPVIEDGPERIAEYIEHRLLRERQILEALGDGRDTIPAMVKKNYAAIPGKLHAMAGQSVESHLRKLEREGRTEETTVRDAPSRWRFGGAPTR